MRLGFGGHFLTKSATYSTTLGALRQVRSDYQHAATLLRLGLADPADIRPDGLLDVPETGPTVLLIGHWTYLGPAPPPDPTGQPPENQPTHANEPGRKRHVTDDPVLLTVPDAMSRLKLGRSKIYDLIRSGELESVTIGRSRRLPADALNRFVAGLGGDL